MRKDMERRDLAFYLGLRYPVTIHADPEGGYVAEIEALPGCMTQAESLEEAFAAIDDARRLWIQTAYQDGHDIPLPRDLEEYGGKFLIRIPKSLHRTLARGAKREGVSLNQYVTSLLSAGAQLDMTAKLLSATIAAPIFASPVGIFGFEREPRKWEEIAGMRRVKLLVRK
jgi:antitoxin HicB